MATKNTLADILFAEQYIEFVARRATSHESRARAAILVSTIRMLDLKFPTWRSELIAELDRADVTKTVENLFPLPDVDADSLFADFMARVVSRERK